MFVACLKKLVTVTITSFNMLTTLAKEVVEHSITADVAAMRTDSKQRSYVSRLAQVEKLNPKAKEVNFSIFSSLRNFQGKHSQSQNTHVMESVVRSSID